MPTSDIHGASAAPVTHRASEVSGATVLGEFLAFVCDSLDSEIGFVSLGNGPACIASRSPSNQDDTDWPPCAGDHIEISKAIASVAPDFDSDVLILNRDHCAELFGNSVHQALVLQLDRHAGDSFGTLCVANRSGGYSAAHAEELKKIATLSAPFLTRELSLALRRSHVDAFDAKEPLEERYHKLEQERDAIETFLQEQLAERAMSEVSLVSLETQMRAILDNTPACVYVKDTEGRYEFINRRFEELFKVTRQEIRGKTDREMFPEHLADQFTRNDQHVAQTGEVLKIDEIAPHDDGPHTYFTTKFPIRDNKGDVCAVAGISTDVTDRIRAEEQAESLSRRLALILDSVGDGVIGLDRRAHVTFLNPTAERLLEWHEQDLLGRPFHEAIQHTRVDGTHYSVVESPIFAACRTAASFMEEDDIFWTRSGAPLPVEHVSTPIMDGDEVTGAVVTFRDISERLAQQESDRLRERAEQELKATQFLQSGLFPSEAPPLDGFEIAGKNYPAGMVSGDFYDYIVRDDGSMMVVVADACGHDLAAAVQMVETHALLHAYMEFDMPVSELLDRLNRTLARNLRGRFVTLFLALLRPGENTLEFAGAGHDATILRADGEVERLKSTGLVLGLEPGTAPAELQTVQLNAGDAALLATDGIHEAMAPSGVIYGRNRVIDSLKEGVDAVRSERTTLEEAVGRICRGAMEFAVSDTPQDDVTAVVIRKL